MLTLLTMKTVCISVIATCPLERKDSNYQSPLSLVGPHYTLNFFLQDETLLQKYQILSYQISHTTDLRTRFFLCSHTQDIQSGCSSQDSFPGCYQAEQNLFLVQSIAECQRAELIRMESCAQFRQEPDKWDSLLHSECTLASGHEPALSKETDQLCEL